MFWTQDDFMAWYKPVPFQYHNVVLEESHFGEDIQVRKHVRYYDDDVDNCLKSTMD